MFQTAKELENLFHTEAAFYKIITGNRVHICRSLATIRRIGNESERVDALVVLLNPGKCLPHEGEKSISLLTGEVAGLPLLPASPDNTMFQLMRLMERMDWNCIRIINLTDLRSEKFEEFLEQYLFMRVHYDNRHDLFSIDRYGELLDYMEGVEMVIAGWGTKSAVKVAAENAFTILDELADVRGLPHKTHPMFYHPFPWLKSKCIDWLEGMEEQLKGVEETVRKNAADIA